jgi:hypothetical protein
MLDTATTNHGNTDSGDNHRQCKTTKPEQPTKGGVDGATKRPCHMEIHGQHKNDAETDAPDSPELDFTTTDYFAGG